MPVPQEFFHLFIILVKVRTIYLS